VPSGLVEVVRRYLQHGEAAEAAEAAEAVLEGYITWADRRGRSALDAVAACRKRLTTQHPRLFAHWAWVPYSWWTG
jgi:hypothetical protein